MTATANAHHDRIREQFSRQATTFGGVAGHHTAIAHLIEISRAGADDHVLDVACGPGLVACAFAPVVAWVTGIDLTPRMIRQARRRQRELRLSNLTWQVGAATPLPYPDASFSLVVTRYSLHHMQDPAAVLAEMARVCRPGGRVLVADVAVEPEHSADYDRLERLRDPSHVHALTRAEFAALFDSAEFGEISHGDDGIDIDLEQQLAASFPNPGDAAHIRDMLVGDIGRNGLGLDVRREGARIVYRVPIAVWLAVRSARGGPESP